VSRFRTFIGPGKPLFLVVGNSPEVVVMTADTRIEGIGHQVKGAVMERIGSRTGNPQLSADGVKELKAGVAQNIAGGDRCLEREAKPT
jgi:uncharacterized protein YjbJ (UPF0337 family)